MTTLETYLKDAAKKGVIDFTLRATEVEGGRMTFYIRPSDTDGDTLDFEVACNQLAPNRDVEQT